jgi:hypothetical protein
MKFFCCFKIVSKKSLAEPCTNSVECNEIIGLTCLIVSNYSLPQTTYMCDCTSDNYFDYNQNQCGMLDSSLKIRCVVIFYYMF